MGTQHPQLVVPRERETERETERDRERERERERKREREGRQMRKCRGTELEIPGT